LNSLETGHRADLTVTSTLLRLPVNLQLFCRQFFLEQIFQGAVFWHVAVPRLHTHNAETTRNSTRS